MLTYDIISSWYKTCGSKGLSNLKKGVKSAEHAHTGPYREYPMAGLNPL